MKTLLLLLLVLLSVAYVLSLGCMEAICESNPSNALRPCPDSDGECGDYGGLRDSKRKVKAVDVKCDRGDHIYAPFAGTMEFWRPFGGSDQANDCADKGVRIEGDGQWQGYVVYIAYVDLDRFGGRVEKGQRLGTMTDYLCMPADKPAHTFHVRVHLFREGRRIDPTHHLHNCMCTGQICESENRNSLIGAPFKTDSRFNGVRGWEISCPDTQDFEDMDASLVDPDTVEWRPPQIRSPIDAERIGRIRLTRAGPHYKGCENDGIFLVGTGKWQGFSVRIYNAKFDNDLGLGEMRIDQGQNIGVRLDCPEKGTNSIFMEMRRNGKMVNGTDMILAHNCALPSIPAK